MDKQARIKELAENIASKKLNLLEEAQQISSLFPRGDLRTIGKAVNRDKKWVSSRIRLLTLDPEIQNLAAVGLITPMMVPLLYAMPKEQQVEAARRIAEVKARGRSRPVSHLGPEFVRAYIPVRRKAQIRRMIATLLDLGVKGLAPRALAWASGGITDAELIEDAKQEIVIQERLSAVMNQCPPKTPPTRRSPSKK